jgi:ParB family transcriptional regulator, chromosome partitioning protein
MRRHDSFMRLPWNKSKEVQLDLLDAETGTTAPPQSVEAAPQSVSPKAHSGAISPASAKFGGRDGTPMMVPMSMLYEDANNPRTEFPEDTLDELAADIQQRGVLRPLVVHPANGDGRHQVHFGAKRLRAAIRAGLHEVPLKSMPATRTQLSPGSSA